MSCKTVSFASPHGKCCISVFHSQYETTERPRTKIREGLAESVTYLRLPTQPNLRQSLWISQIYHFQVCQTLFGQARLSIFCKHDRCYTTNSIVTCWRGRDFAWQFWTTRQVWLLAGHAEGRGLVVLQSQNKFEKPANDCWDFQIVGRKMSEDFHKHRVSVWWTPLRLSIQLSVLLDSSCFPYRRKIYKFCFPWDWAFISYCVQGLGVLQLVLQLGIYYLLCTRFYGNGCQRCTMFTPEQLWPRVTLD